MYHEAYIALVYTHAKGYRCTDYLYSVIQEIVLYAVSFRIRKPRMIHANRKSFLSQMLCKRLCGFPGKTVDDTAFMGMTTDKLCYRTEFFP